MVSESFTRWLRHTGPALLLFAAFPPVSLAQSTTSGKILTVERIYGEPSLSGRPTRGLQWSPDGTRLGYLQTVGADKAELWVIDSATGNRSVLITADRLASILPGKLPEPTQATGLGRRPPSPYQWAHSGKALLFARNSSLAWFDLRTQTSRILVSSRESLADAKISPDDRYVSFVRGHNLWLVSVADGKERPLTRAGTEEVREGELDWVYPEELKISTAYWWAPDSTAIAYLEMDEHKVSRYPLVDFASPTGEPEMERYPTPGGANPIVRVFVASIHESGVRVMDAGADADIYIPRVSWLADSKHLAIQRLNRLQTQLDLLIADARTGETHVVITEKDKYWINVSDDLHFLREGTRFLWSSERSGYRRLYLYDLGGNQLAQITKGEWEVTTLDAVDESGGFVYFTATAKSPLERQVFRVSMDGSGFTPITVGDGTHAANFSPNCQDMIDTYSNINAPPRQDLLRADGSRIASIDGSTVPDLADYHLSPVEFLTVKSHDGILLNAMMIKPPEFNAQHKYPVIVYTYGGPGVQVVRNAWGGTNFLWNELMAQKGYIIFALDNRGSAGRGHLFEEPIHYRLGAQELSDQRDGVAYLRELPYVDASRIGIWGWSYGGHMTLHAMFEAPQDFKVGFAGGPVADWLYYDSIYTERYLGLLPENQESYQESSPVKNAEKLRGKLLIAHGTADETVHFANTLELIDELIKARKFVEVLPFPGRGHEVSDSAARIVLFRRVTEFFVQNL
jgi:dipeptidyl-peptidase-4